MNLTKMTSSDSTGNPNIGRVEDIGDRFMYKENIIPNYEGGMFHTREKVWGGRSEADQSKSCTRHDLVGSLIPRYRHRFLPILEFETDAHQVKHRSTKFKTGKKVLSKDNIMDDPYTPLTPWNNDLLKLRSALSKETQVKFPLALVDSDNIKRGKAIVEESNGTGKKRFRCEDSELYPNTIIRDRNHNICRTPLKDTLFELKIQDKMLENEYANKQKEWQSEIETLLYAVENLRNHNLELNNILKEVSMERKWLIEEGFRHVVNNLLHSEEFLGEFGELHSKLLKSEIQEGFQAGYSFCERGVPIDRAILYRPQAEEDFKVAILEQLDSINFQYLEAISACVNKPLSVLQSLEPRGLKREKVGLEVAATAGSGTVSTPTF